MHLITGNFDKQASCIIGDCDFGLGAWLNNIATCICTKINIKLAINAVQLHTHNVHKQTVYLEKKKLLQQWNNSLIGMRRRDEAYSAMITAVK